MKNKKLSILGLITVMMTVAVTGYAAGILATPSGILTHGGPFEQRQFAVDSTAGKGPGGDVEQLMTKSSDTLKIGEVVSICGINIVCKDTTTLSRDKVFGVVIGGYSTSFRVLSTITDTSTRASLPSRWVYVLRRGRTYCLVGASAIPPGTAIKPSGATAGRVVPGDSTDKANRLFAIAVDSGAAGKAVLCDLNK